MKKRKTNQNYDTRNSKKVKKNGILNTKPRDSSSKLIFEDNTLCAQFLRGYTNIPQLQNVQPEDIEDVSERYVHMFTEERNSDVVKKVKIRNNGMPFYLISLVEHKSNIDYNTVMQILRYMVFIWEDYEREQNKKHKGISKTKGFKYPPVLPLIFYDGVDDWTAALRLKERIYLSDIFTEYIPDYKCMLIQIQNYSNQEIMEKKDEFSILMLINKLREAADFKNMEKEIPSEYLKEVTENTPEYLLRIMAEVVSVLLSKLMLSQEEVDDFIEQIKERKMGELFKHFKGYDVPAMRIKIRDELRDEVRNEVRDELRDKVRNEVRDELRDKVRNEVKDELRDEVKDELRDESIEAFILILKELNVEKEIAYRKLVDKFGLNAEDIKEKLKQY